MARNKDQAEWRRRQRAGLVVHRVEAPAEVQGVTGLARALRDGRATILPPTRKAARVCGDAEQNGGACTEAKEC